jgi:sugar phosphate isomerase/epimerase
MEIKFYCPLWGSESLDFNLFCERVKAAGYDGVELSFPMEADKKSNMLVAIKSFELEHIAQHWETSDLDFNHHKKNYEKRLINLIETEPKFINTQTGKDFFSFEQNQALINIAEAIKATAGLDIIHETHRGKFSFACHITHDFLNKIPELRLNFDISHWCCVAESMLENQSEAVQLAISRADHIHARVGYSQGAQINDPRVPEWSGIVDVFIDWWQQIINRAIAEGKSEFGITPEFGPYPYMVEQPFTRQAIADQWELNVFMKTLLKERLIA